MCALPRQLHIFFAQDELGIISRKVEREVKNGMECNVADAIQRIRLTQQIGTL